MVSDLNKRWLSDRYLDPLSQYADGLINRDELRSKLCHEIDRPSSRNGAGAAGGIQADENLGTTD